VIDLDKRKEMAKSLDNRTLSVRKRCDLLCVNRSSLYIEKQVVETALNLELMEHIDRQYLDHPEFGAERMHTWLVKDKLYQVNLKRINRLYYEVMGLRSLLPGPHTSKGNKEHKKYPYLLRKLKINRPNQVWQIDITYIPMHKGFMYMIGIIDVCSRKLLHWDIGNTMEALWCCGVLEECIVKYGRPDIINTDQGSQFTSDDFVYRVINNGIKLSMDGQGRALDNIYIERFWRTVKYEHIYIRPARDGKELRDGIEWFIKWYNTERRHTELDNITPDAKYLTYINQELKAA
jgi:putative transposase